MPPKVHTGLFTSFRFLLQHHPLGLTFNTCLKLRSMDETSAAEVVPRSAGPQLQDAPRPGLTPSAPPRPAGPLSQEASLHPGHQLLPTSVLQGLPRRSAGPTHAAPTRRGSQPASSTVPAPRPAPVPPPQRTVASSLGTRKDRGSMVSCFRRAAGGGAPPTRGGQVRARAVLVFKLKMILLERKPANSV